MTDAPPFLRVSGLAKSFGGLSVLERLDLDLGAGELLCVVGPNGCGKTTLFNLLSGQLRPDAGAASLAGRDLTRLRPHQISRLGVGRKFQAPSVYDDLSVRENFIIPLFAEAGRRGLLGLFGRDRAGEDAEIKATLAMVGLAGRADAPAADLSHGEKQWLEIGLVLAGRPRLMLLDEPTAGMTGPETRRTVDLVRAIHNARGCAIIMIEHDMGFVEGLECPVAVMMRGRVIAHGAFDEVRALREVREGYLGAGHA